MSGERYASRDEVRQIIDVCRSTGRHALADQLEKRLAERPDAVGAELNIQVHIGGTLEKFVGEKTEDSKPFEVISLDDDRAPIVTHREPAPVDRCNYLGGSADENRNALLRQ